MKQNHMWYLWINFWTGVKTFLFTVLPLLKKTLTIRNGLTCEQVIKGSSSNMTWWHNCCANRNTSQCTWSDNCRSNNFFFKSFFNKGDTNQANNSKDTNKYSVGTRIGISKVKKKRNWMCCKFIGLKKVSHTLKPWVNKPD